MPNSIVEKSIIVGFRLAMAWTFLYSAAHQILDPNWSVARFLSQTKTFHDVYSVFTTPQWSPIMTVIVEYGHLLIGLSLLVGTHGPSERELRDTTNGNVLDRSHGFSIY